MRETLRFTYRRWVSVASGVRLRERASGLARLEILALLTACLLLGGCPTHPTEQRGSEGKGPAATSSDRSRQSALPSNGAQELVAPPGQETTAAAQLAARLQVLEQSGSAPQDLIARCVLVFDSWRKEDAVIKRRAVFGVPVFRAGGCAISLTHVEPQYFSEVMGAIAKSGSRESPRSWKGAIFRSGPIAEPGGTLQYTWILFEKT